MTASPIRPGKHPFPKWMLQQCELSTDERWLLVYLDSHDYSKWTFHVWKVEADAGWGRGKYYKVRKSLVEKGRLRTSKLYGRNSITGKKEVVGFNVTHLDLSAEISNLENGPKCRKPTSSKSTQLSNKSYKGATAASVAEDGEVIDLQDDGFDPE